MTAAAALVRFARLSWRNRLLLAEATIMLTLSSAAIAVLPFRRSVALGAHGLTGTARTDLDAARPICWSVRRAAAAVPWKAVCFQQGLALRYMLRRRGFDARLHYGIGKKPNDVLAAHVWVTSDGVIVLGEEAVCTFRPVLIHP